MVPHFPQALQHLTVSASPAVLCVPHEQLGGAVPPGGDVVGAGLARTSQQPREPEVAQLDDPEAAHQHVLWLDISMDDLSSQQTLRYLLVLHHASLIYMLSKCLHDFINAACFMSP